MPNRHFDDPDKQAILAPTGASGSGSFRRAMEASGTGSFRRAMEAATVPCALCGQPTEMLATRRCDRCWELEHRMLQDPVIALKVLREHGLVG